MSRAFLLAWVKRRRQYWLLVIAALCVTAVTLGLILRIGSRPSDYQQLQGTWVTDDDRVLPHVNGKLVVEEGFSDPRKLLFWLDPNASPKRITFCEADGPGISPPFSILGLTFGTPFAEHPNLQMRGIYELEGNRLRILQSGQGKDYPKSFDSKTSTSVQLFRRR